MEISKEIKKEFYRSVLGNRPFEYTYTSKDGEIKIVFRTQTSNEVERMSFIPTEDLVKARLLAYTKKISLKGTHVLVNTFSICKDEIPVAIKYGEVFGGLSSSIVELVKQKLVDFFELHEQLIEEISSENF